ncbi:MAG: putative PEP-CTERM system TPR-repeat lipoprotein [Halioglobus sp.]
MIHRSWLFLSLLALALGSALPSQATAGETAHKYYEDAQRYHDNGDQKSALIQLKNALSQDNQHVPSLVLSGDIYLLQGDPAAAEFIYGESLLLGADDDYAIPRLAEAYLLQNKYHEILTQLNTDQLTGSGKAELLGYRALAQLGTNDQLAADRSIIQALSINPQARAPNIAKAQILLEKEQLATAKQVTEELTRLYPLDARSWNIHGVALSTLGLNAQAIAAYSQAVENNPSLPSARLARAALLAAADRREEATADVDYVRANHPQDPRGAYMKAQFLEYDGEKKAALKLYAVCLENLSLAPAEYLSQHVQLSIMGAISAIKTREPERARFYLETYQNQNRNDLESGRMLADIYLESGDAKAATSVLKPLLTMAPEDPVLLKLNARALNLHGRYKRSISELQYLRKIGHGDIDVDAQIAMNQIMGGDFERGISGMEKVLSRDSTRVQETALLATTYLKRGNYARATTLAETLIQLAPRIPEFRNLLGRSHMYNGELERAHAVLQSATNEHPGFLPILISLAEVETLEAKLSEARERLVALSNAYPESAEVMLQRARVERLLDNSESARKWAEKAVLANGNWIDPRQFLVHLLLEMDKPGEAEKLASESSAKMPEDMALKFQLAEVLVAVGKPQKARSTYQLMAKRADSDHELLYRIALQQTKMGAFSDASLSLFRATTIEPGSFVYRRAYIQVELKLENYTVAMKLAKELGQQFPASTIPYSLRAAAYSGLGQKRAAVKELVSAAQMEPDNRRLLLEHYTALAAMGEFGQAEKILSNWLEKSPQDQTVNRAYADLMITTKQWPEAETLLSVLVKKHPGNPLLLNNLAFVLHEMGRPEAIDIARQAQAIAPKMPALNDTLGWILVENAQPKEGLLYLREAVARQSDVPTFRYHLAVALHDLGRQSEAVKQLKLALRETGEFEGRAQAMQLLDKLQWKAREDSPSISQSTQ